MKINFKEMLKFFVMKQSPPANNFQSKRKVENVNELNVLKLKKKFFHHFLNF